MSQLSDPHGQQFRIVPGRTPEAVAGMLTGTGEDPQERQPPAPDVPQPEDRRRRAR